LPAKTGLLLSRERAAGHTSDVEVAADQPLDARRRIRQQVAGFAAPRPSRPSMSEAMRAAANLARAGE
jgi:hypothetical protein